MITHAAFPKTLLYCFIGPPRKAGPFFTNLHSAGDLTRTEASGAHIDVLGRAVDNRLDALHIGLPRTVGAAVRVGHPDAEHNALIAKFTFGHSLIPPRSSG